MKGFVEQGVCSELVNVSVADLTQFVDVLVGFLGAASLYTIYCRSYLWCLEFTVGIAMYTSAWSSCQNAQHLLSIFGGICLYWGRRTQNYTSSMGSLLPCYGW
jgi:hypothetical protein